MERNNFDGSSENSDPTRHGEICKSTKTVPKSIANAQIMLRFGGDDILGKNHLGTIGKAINRPTSHYHPSASHMCQHSDIIHPHIPYYNPGMYPLPPHGHSVPIPTYAPTFPSHYAYPPPPPYSFPGFYYNNMNRHAHQIPAGLRNGKFR